MLEQQHPTAVSLNDALHLSQRPHRVLVTAQPKRIHHGIHASRLHISHPVRVSSRHHRLSHRRPAVARPQLRARLLHHPIARVHRQQRAHFFRVIIRKVPSRTARHLQHVAAGAVRERRAHVFDAGPVFTGPHGVVKGFRLAIVRRVARARVDALAIARASTERGTVADDDARARDAGRERGGDEARKHPRDDV